MKQFVKHILLFSLPVLMVLGLIFFLKANREFCYNYIKGDCDARGKSFYKRIYTNTNSVDYLFVGSSKTMNGINDGLIEDSLNKHSVTPLHLYNAGYCRFGRNLDVLLCREFAKNNHLKKIFLEVRRDESTTSHPIYAYLANGKDILNGALALNGSLFPEVYNHLLMNLNYFRCQLHLQKPEKNTASYQPHGYNNIEKVLDKNSLQDFYKEEKTKYANMQVDVNALEYHYSRFYLNHLKAFCDKHQIELNFIYLPSFGNANKLPGFKEEYEKWGKVIVGPDSIFTNTSYWKDVAHFNTAGATAYSKFLANELAR